MNLQTRTIAVIGLGYVGLSLGRARADCHAPYPSPRQAGSREGLAMTRFYD